MINYDSEIINFADPDLESLWEQVNRTNDATSIDCSDYHFVLGIDFGHGKTAAEYIHFDKDASVEAESNETSPAPIYSGKNVIPSIYAEGAGGNPIIGQAAFGAECINLSLGFKTRPRKWAEDSNEKENIKKFMKASYNNILEQTSALSRGNHIITIGCPCAWDKTEREQYKKLFHDAINENHHVADQIPLQAIRYTKEARAAAIYARRSANLAIPPQAIEQGLLMIDMGSSTIDFTHIQKGLKLDDDGLELGASLIDALIILFGLCDDSLKSEEVKAIANEIRKEPKHIYYAVSQCRDAKELYYAGNPYAQFSYEFNKKLKLYIRGDVKNALDTVINSFAFPLNSSWKEVLEKGLETIQKMKIKWESNQGQTETVSSLCIQVNDAAANNCYSWIDHLKNYLHRLKTRLDGEGRQVSTVMLTGGASQMDFIAQLVQCEFNATIYRDPQPFLSIAKGITLAGRTDIKTSGLRDQLFRTCDLAIDYYTGSQNISKLVLSLQDDIFAVFESIYSFTLNEWRKKFFEGKDELEKRLAVAQEKFQEKLNEIIKENIKNNTLAITDKIFELLNSVCHSYGYTETIRQYEPTVIADMSLEQKFTIPDSVIFDSTDRIAKLILLVPYLNLLAYIVFWINRNEVIEKIKAQYGEMRSHIQQAITDEQVAGCYQDIASYINKYVKSIIDKATIEIDIEEDAVSE